MDRIVLVHGAFNELWGPHELAARWTPALRDGMWRVGRDLSPDVVDVCFYGDLFRRDPERTDDAAWASARAEAEEQLADLAGTDTLAALNELVGRQTYRRTVDMFAAMAADPTLTDRVRQRLVDVIGADTRIVVAHSLGSVVAHQVLTSHREIEVDTLVTLGSPLGAVPFRLVGDQWPGRTRRWVNVVAPTDPVTEPGRVPRVFGDRVEERLVDNGHRGHHPEPYLNSFAVGQVVADALGGS